MCSKESKARRRQGEARTGAVDLPRLSGRYWYFRYIISRFRSQSVSLCTSSFTYLVSTRSPLDLHYVFAPISTVPSLYLSCHLSLFSLSLRPLYFSSFHPSSLASLFSLDHLSICSSSPRSTVCCLLLAHELSTLGVLSSCL